MPWLLSAMMVTLEDPGSLGISPSVSGWGPGGVGPAVPQLNTPGDSWLSESESCMDHVALVWN